MGRPSFLLKCFRWYNSALVSFESLLLAPKLRQWIWKGEWNGIAFRRIQFHWIRLSSLDSFLLHHLLLPVGNETLLKGTWPVIAHVPFSRIARGSVVSYASGCYPCPTRHLYLNRLTLFGHRSVIVEHLHSRNFSLFWSFVGGGSYLLRSCT